VKLAAVLTAGGLALIGAYLALRSQPTTRLEFAFSDDPAENIYETIMPSDGQICIVDDLNHRSGPVADQVREFSDVEGAHWIIGLDGVGDVLFHYSVLSRTGPDNTPVAAKSYCEPRKAGETIQIGVRFSDDPDVWYLTLPVMN
jgi:hypothetical protein